MIALESRPEGVVIPVKALPGAKRNECRGEADGALRLSVTAAPEKGKANQALVKLLAQLLQVRKARIELLSGDTHAKKLFLVGGATIDELAPRLAALLAELG